MTTLSGIADAAIEREWATDPRWAGIERSYEAADVIRLRGTVRVEHSLARRGAEQLWRLLHTEDYVNALGAMTGGQAIEMVKAGLKAIYLSGWQVAADANLSEQVYPDQSLYAANSVPAAVRRINNALRRADQIEWAETFAAGETEPQHEWLVPIVADAEAGFGGALNVYELMRSMIEAGAAGVHFEDQLSSEKKCGHMGGKVLIPTGQHVRTLNAARLAADVAGVPTIIIARTDSLGANLLTTDVDPRDQEFATGERSPEGFYYVQPGIEQAVARALAYAPHADLIWCETATPDLDEARVFAERIKAEYPDKLLAYNCSPSFNWRKHLDDDTIARFQRELGAMGYAFQFVTLAGWHALNESAFRLARGYANHGMTAYVDLQQSEFALEQLGYTATRHQREVGAGYFDDITSTLSSGLASTLALAGSTEEAQFGV
ncbi:MAG TPA: isocitrate lyase [Solirubrobacteraceae bacterium]|jgi:isocitrate lyase|nr:isocitrate lyase [Solirubrobacteraceae bacterium]